jgi:RNA polymerase-binding transcription factor
MPQPQVADRDRYDELKAMLEERRREITDKLRSIRETLPAQRDEVTDAEEQSVIDFAKDMEFALMQMKADTLSKIDEALRRLEAGTYGTCDECGNSIAAPRLKAVPFATRCRDCQETYESQEAVERQAPMRALPALESI